MGVLGGFLGYRLLRWWSPRGATAEKYCTGSAYEGKSKLKVFFGEEIIQDLVGKVVLDYGCGSGQTCIELARAGVRCAVGVDIQDQLLEEGRSRARAEGVEDRCVFLAHPRDKADVVISLDSFEHFDDPAQALRHMRELLRDDGYLLAEFGPTWYHPLGGHLFSVFPWAHLIFTERALIRWRADFKADGATRFGEVAGGLNKMTIRRWERLVAESPFSLTALNLRPIRGLTRFHNRITREWLTAVVVARLEPRHRHS